MNLAVLAFQLGLLIAAFVLMMIRPSKDACNGAFLGPKHNHREMLRQRGLCTAAAHGILAGTVLATMAHFF